MSGVVHFKIPSMRMKDVLTGLAGGLFRKPRIGFISPDIFSTARSDCKSDPDRSRTGLDSSQSS